jgi:hypothetical protein
MGDRLTMANRKFRPQLLVPLTPPVDLYFSLVNFGLQPLERFVAIEVAVESLTHCPGAE